MNGETTAIQRQRQQAETQTLPIITEAGSTSKSSEAISETDYAKKAVTLDQARQIVAQLESKHGKPIMPGVGDEPKPSSMHVRSVNGSFWTAAWSGLCAFLKRLVGIKPVRIVDDPLNGNVHCFTRVEYVSRWGLVEFGVTCPKCEALAAGPGQFKRIWKTGDGEALTCPECKSTLLASPTTEKEEHLLEYSPKLHLFSRKRHPMSPYSTQQAAEIRETLPKRLAADPFASIEKEASNV